MEHQLCSVCGARKVFKQNRWRCVRCQSKSAHNIRHVRRQKIDAWYGTNCVVCGRTERLVLYRELSQAQVSRSKAVAVTKYTKRRYEDVVLLCPFCLLDRLLPNGEEGHIHRIAGRKRFFHHSGYWVIYYPEHPFAWKGCGLVPLHRLVVENDLGRLLRPNEIIHHKDGDKTNNDLSNLDVLTCSEHAKTHRPKTTYVCAHCGTTFESIKRRHTQVFCSASCTRRYRSNASKCPDAAELAKMVWKYPTSVIAKKYGVSDVAVAKWCKKHGVEKPPRGYWQKLEAGKINGDIV